MGSQFNYVVLMSKCTVAAVEEANNVILEACVTDGIGGYTGSFSEAAGVEFRVPIQPPIDPEDWLYRNCKKWGPAIVVEGPGGVYHMGAECSD